MIKSQNDLISCLKLHSPAYFSWLEPKVDEIELEAPRDESPEISPDDCNKVRQALVREKSLESSLTFRLAELNISIRNEVIRLAGLVALCRHFEPELSERISNEALNPLLSKYLSIE